MDKNLLGLDTNGVLDLLQQQEYHHVELSGLINGSTNKIVPLIIRRISELQKLFPYNTDWNNLTKEQIDAGRILCALRTNYWKIVNNQIAKNEDEA